MCQRISDGADSGARTLIETSKNPICLGLISISLSSLVFSFVLKHANYCYKCPQTLVAGEREDDFKQEIEYSIIDRMPNKWPED